MWGHGSSNPELFFLHDHEIPYQGYALPCDPAILPYLLILILHLVTPRLTLNSRNFHAGVFFCSVVCVKLEEQLVSP